MDLIKVLQLIFLCLLPCHVFAIEAPNEVYRIESRTPDYIFEHGFSSWGESIELLRHVNGESLIDRTSGLISTSSDYDVMRDIAINYLINEGHHNEVLWIYTITPGYQFHDVNGSLLHANMLSEGGIIAGQTLYTYANFAHEEEFAAEGHILPSQVRSAVSARYMRLPNGEEIVYIDNDNGVSNPQYVPTPASISTEFLPVIPMPSDFPVYYAGDLRWHPVTASLDVHECVGVGGQIECEKTLFSTTIEVIKRKVFATFN